MSRYITLGIYTNQGAAGLVDGDSDPRLLRPIEFTLEPNWWTITLPVVNMTSVS